jgi:hypothetical protein
MEIHEGIQQWKVPANNDDNDNDNDENPAIKTKGSGQAWQSRNNRIGQDGVVIS